MSDHVLLYLQKPEVGTRFTASGVMDGYEQSCRCWESNQGHLEEQRVPLTTEPYLQPQTVTQKFNESLNCSQKIKDYPYVSVVQLCLPNQNINLAERRETYKTWKFTKLTRLRKFLTKSFVISSKKLLAESCSDAALLLSLGPVPKEPQ